MNIRKIEAASIHRICTSQVIADLPSAVKELIENALDAKATIVEVRLRNMGAETIEIHDNGQGIPSIDYETIALSHATSKLRSFEDLSDLRSYGFRGEALNALCQLSHHFTVTTRQAHELVGTQLFFHADGQLKEKKVVARGVGTTVLVERLFESLPVRRMELLR